MPRLIAALLLLPLSAAAQWQADTQRDTFDLLGFGWVVYAGVAFIVCRDRYKVSEQKGNAWLVGFIAYGVLALVWRPAAILMGMAAGILFLWWFFDQVRGR